MWFVWPRHPHVQQGRGRFRYGGEYGLVGPVERLAIADLDGDRKQDLVATMGDHLSVLLNRGDGTFLDPADYPGGSGPIAVADLNGDGSADLVGEWDVSTAAIWLNRGDGTFGSRVDYRVGRGGRDDVAVADVNGDGATDVITPNDKDATLSVLLNLGDGTFGPRQDYPSGREPRSVAVADLNGDGKPDLAATVHGGVSILLNLGDGAFQLRREYRVGGSRRVASGDLNGDGKADLAIASGRGVAVLLGRGDGRFRAKLDYLSGGRVFRSAWQIAVNDLNGDARLDLAVTNISEPSDLAVLLNTPGLCNVQYVTGVTPAAAKRILPRVNCRVGKVHRTYSKKIKRGLVISQDPAFGAIRPRGTKVKLVVSLGRKR